MALVGNFFGSCSPPDFRAENAGHGTLKCSLKHCITRGGSGVDTLLPNWILDHIVNQLNFYFGF